MFTTAPAPHPKKIIVLDAHGGGGFESVNVAGWVRGKILNIFSFSFTDMIDH